MHRLQAAVFLIAASSAASGARAAVLEEFVPSQR
jgi:hypothetical protein